jgi:hypothetical protein
MRAIHSATLDSWCAVDLTMPQLKALPLAHAPSGASHGEIARALGVGVSTVTGITPATKSTFALLPTDQTSGNFTKVTQLVPVRIAVNPGDQPSMLGSSVEVKIQVA